MAPNLNTMLESPRFRDRATSSSIAPQTHSRPPSRRTSTTMPPPPVPPNISSPNSPRAAMSGPFDNSGVGLGPGPIRHPRPMTPAQLHLELEKEQEGIVNRLTRELSLLRQQTASVASTTSSASELLADHPIIVPTSARRHRSSSNLSTRSINATTTNATSVSGVAPARETSVPSSSRPSMDLTRPVLSRENSIISTGGGRRSITASPSITSAQLPHTHSHSQRQSLASQQSGYNPADSHANHVRTPSFSAAVAAARYEEAAFHRAELDSVKKENEQLKQKIRDLERRISNRPSDESRSGRSTVPSFSGSVS